MTEDLTTKSASELAALIRTRAVSPVEITQAHLEGIQRINPSLNAIVTIAPDLIDSARAAEAAVMRGEAIGPLHGLPLTIKDTIETKGLRTTGGSRLRANHVPDRDATVVARLKAAGAIILGKTNTPEMAIPYETDNPVFGRTNNPYDPERTPGGSSGGEAAAIAACLSPAGIGSDLSGSIRVPAHFCGIAGLKPTTGRVPMDGHLPVASGPLALGACIGPMARRVDDLALLFGVIADAVQFEIDLETANVAGLPNTAELQGMRAAWYTNDGVAPVDEETAHAVEAAAKSLSDAGLEIVQATPPGVSQGSRLWVELFSHAGMDQTQRFYRGREVEAGPQVASLLRVASEQEGGREANVQAADRLAKAVVEHERLREELLRWMKATPLIVAPVGATCAFKHGAERLDIRGESVSVFRAFSYSQTFNVFGFPCVAVPAGRSRAGLPIGVQVIGRPFQEWTALAAAAIIEEALGGWQRAGSFLRSWHSL
jgi:amidase